MRKLTLILSLILTQFIVSCDDSNATYTLTYVVFYPTKPDTITNTSNDGFYWYSEKGTNTIINTANQQNVYNNTSPFKILSYTKQPNK
jgi:hypothetical protein